MKFHPAKQHCSKDMRPYMESPWSVVFKYIFTFNFLIYSGMVLGCQRKCPILPKTTKNGKNSQKRPIFKWNSTQLNVPDDQKKNYPYFLHTIRHSKNNSHFTVSHFCYFQLYLMHIGVLIFFDFSSFLVWKRWQHFPLNKIAPFSQEKWKLVKFAYFS